MVIVVYVKTLLSLGLMLLSWGFRQFKRELIRFMTVMNKINYAVELVASPMLGILINEQCPMINF